VQVRRGLLVEDEEISAGLDEGVGVPLRPLDHEMNLEGELRPAPHRLDDRNPQGQVGHEQPVHDVDVEPIRPAPLGVGDLLPEAQAVRGEDGGKDLHARVSPWARATVRVKAAASRTDFT